MSTLIANTTTIKENIDLLKKRQTYYSSKVKTFSDFSNFNASSNVSVKLYLAKLRKSYQALSDNLQNLIVFLEDYVSDIEAIEYKVSNMEGYSCKAEEVKHSVETIRNCMIDLEIENAVIFNIKNITIKDVNTSVSSFQSSNEFNSTGSNSSLSFSSSMGLTEKKGFGTSMKSFLLLGLTSFGFFSTKKDLLSKMVSSAIMENKERAANMANSVFQKYSRYQFWRSNNASSIVSFAKETYKKTTAKVKETLSSITNYVNGKAPVPELIIEDSEYEQTYQEYLKPIDIELKNINETQKVLEKEYAKYAEIEEYRDKIAKFQKYGLLKYGLLGSKPAEVISAKLPERYQEIIRKDFASMEDYENYIGQLKDLMSNCDMAIVQAKNLKEVGKYECLDVLEDFQKFNYNPKVNTKDLNMQCIDSVMYYSSYEEYCKKNGSVSELAYAEALGKAIDNLKTSGGIEEIEIDSHTQQLINLAKVSNKDADYAKYYNYLYKTYGIGAANEYLSVMEPIVNNILGKEQAEKMLSHLTTTESVASAIKNHINTTEMGFGAGGSSFVSGVSYALSGVKAFFTKEAPTRANSIDEYANMYVQDALQSGNYTGKFLKDNYVVSQGIGNMAPSIALSTFGVPVAGSIALGVSAGGNSYHGAMVDGYSNVQAISYGIISGFTEALTEKYLGGLPGLSDVEVTGLKTYVQAMIKEGNEEAVQEVFDSVVRRGIFKENINSDELLVNVGESWKYGTITAGVLQTPSAIFNSIQVKNRNDLNSVTINSADLDAKMQDIGLDMDEKLQNIFRPDVLKTEIEKFDLEKFFLKDGTDNTAVLLITPEQSIMTECFAGKTKEYGNSDQHAATVGEIYKVIYDDGQLSPEVQTDEEILGEKTQKDGNILIQLCQDSSSNIWLPKTINSFQYSALEKFCNEINAISEKNKIKLDFWPDFNEYQNPEGLQLALEEAKNRIGNVDLRNEIIVGITSNNILSSKFKDSNITIKQQPIENLEHFTTEEYLDKLKTKYNYNSELINSLSKIISAMIQHFGKENKNIILNALYNSEIHIQESGENPKNYLSNFFEKDYEWNPPFGASGFHYQDLTVKDNQVNLKHIIYMLNHDGNFNLSNDGNLATLVHELCHLVKSYNRVRIIDGKIVSFSGFMYNEFDLQGKFLNSDNSNIHVGIEEALNCYDEEKIMEQILGHPYESSEYNGITKLIGKLMENDEIKKAIRKTQFAENNEWMHLFGTEIANQLMQDFDTMIKTSYISDKEISDFDYDAEFDRLLEEGRSVDEIKEILQKQIEEDAKKLWEPYNLAYADAQNIIDNYNKKGEAINIEHLVEQNPNIENKSYVTVLVKYLEKLIPEKCRDNLYRNLSSANIQLNLATDLTLVPKLKLKGVGGYDIESNKLIIQPVYLKQVWDTAQLTKNPNSFYQNEVGVTILHELAHLASSYFNKKLGIRYCGFDIVNLNYPNNIRNIGLTEGMTECIAMAGFPGTVEISSGYYIEALFVNQLINLVGIDVMKESYFGNKGTASIEKSLNDIINNKSLSFNLFRNIENNFQNRNINQQQSYLGNAQNAIVDYYKSKIIKNLVEKNMTLSEVENSISNFEKFLITPEKLKIMNKNPDNYIGLNESLKKFSDLKNMILKGEIDENVLNSFQKSSSEAIEVLDTTLELDSILPESFYVQLNSDATESLVNTKVLEDILNDSNVFEKFLHYDENQIYFDNEPKGIYIKALEEYIEIKRKNNSITADENIKYNKIMTEAYSELDSFINLFSKTLSAPDGDGLVYTGEWLKKIILKHGGYEEFSSLPATNEKINAYIFLESLKKELYENHKWVPQALDDLLKKCNDDFKKLVNKEDVYFSELDSYGIYQHAIQNVLHTDLEKTKSLIERVRKIKPELSKKEAYKFLSEIDREIGVCDYAAILNELLVIFKHHPDRQNFDFDLFTEKDGVKQLNAVEWLTDFYTFCNSKNPKIFQKKFMGYRINGSEKNGLIYAKIVNDVAINKYLKYHNIDINQEIKHEVIINTKSSNKNGTVNLSSFEMDYIKSQIANELKDGLILCMAVYDDVDYPIIFKSIDSNTRDVSSSNWKERSGHAIVITGLTDNGLLVSSWGKRYELLWNDLKHNQFSIHRLIHE